MGSAKISAIIVALNEDLLIENIITVLRKQRYLGEVEILLADGGSTDKTTALASAQNIKIVVSNKSCKAVQINKAAREATGDILFFIHADMQFPENVFSSIENAIKNGYVGGGFTNVFDTHNDKIKRLGNIMNFRLLDRREQSDKGVFYGDNGIFVMREIFEKLNGFKEIPMMEDYDFSKRLNVDHKTIKIKNPPIVVSARRHIKAGFFLTRLQWVLFKKLYILGVSPFLLAKWYKNIR